MKRIGRNSEDIKKFNRSLVLQILAKRDICSRAELAVSTGLTQATITKIVDSMIEAGVVKEGGMIAGKLDRRSINIKLNKHICKVLAVKIARKSFDVAAFCLDGTLIEQNHIPIDISHGARFAIEQIKKATQAMCNRYLDIMAIGMAVPGPYMYNEGKIAIMSEFSGWDKIDIRNEFTSEFDLPIIIEHDANAGALAEWNGRLNKNGDVLLCFLASEGIGSGIISDGVIFRGNDGVAGEVGHMSINMHGPKCSCGNYGCLEKYCSAISFVRWVQEDLIHHPESSLNSEPEITPEVVFKHMKQGDPFSIEEVKKVGAYMGYGIANAVYLYNPNEIVITDIMTGGGEILLNAIKEVVKERVLPRLYQDLEIRLSTSKYDTILKGAAALAIDFLFEHPAMLYTLNVKCTEQLNPAK